MEKNEFDTLLLKDRFVVDVLRLKGRNSFVWTLPSEWLTEIFSQCEYDVQPISGTCEIVCALESTGIRVTGSAKIQAKTECGTCLDKLKLDLCAPIDTFMQPESASGTAQDELTPEDLEIEYYTGSSFALDEIIADMILLELPMIPRCEKACRQVNGLVTAAELAKRETTVDPRLSALADIQLSKES